MLLNINFGNLSVEGYTALILAVIFSIFTFASIIYYAKHKNINKIMLAVITLVLPALTIFCWVYLLTTALSLKLVYALCISLGCAVAYVLVATLIAYLLGREQTQKEETITETKSENEVKKEETEVVEEEIPVLIVEKKTKKK